MSLRFLATIDAVLISASYLHVRGSLYLILCQRKPALCCAANID